MLDTGQNREGTIPEIAFVLARSNRRAEAEKCLNELLAVSGEKKVAFNLAKIYAGLGENERAVEALQQAQSERASDLAFVELDAVFDNLHSPPKFTRIAHRND